MRDIKFRAWDKKYKYMNYKVLVGMWGEDVLDDENYTACSMWIEPKNVDYECKPHWGHFEPYHTDIDLMQYTGFKDCNGKEIYEGDILEREGYFCMRIVYEDGSFIAEDAADVKLNCFSISEYIKNIDSTEWKVIGNIYNISKKYLNDVVTKVINECEEI